jgi:hypothetical protein
MTGLKPELQQVSISLPRKVQFSEHISVHFFNYSFNPKNITYGTYPKLSCGTYPKLSCGTYPKLFCGTYPKLSCGTYPKSLKGAYPKLSYGTDPKSLNGAYPKLSCGTYPKLSITNLTCDKLILSYKNHVKQVKNSTVFTIGDVNLSSNQVEVLEKGLSFVPTIEVFPDPNLLEIESLADPINRLISNLKDRVSESGSSLVLKGLNQPKALELNFNYTTSLIKTVKDKHASIPPTIHNLNTQQLQVLRNLKINPSFIIKAVDKNLGIAVIDKEIYIRLVNEQHLNDISTYSKLNSDPLNSTIQTINSTLTCLHDRFSISSKALEQLKAKPDSSNGVFYILPKLHKGKLESRPICANSNHPTKQISEYLHTTLLPTAKNSFSYLDNSYELTKLLKNVTVTPGTIIITADIKSLYTRIPTTEGPRIVSSSTGNNIDKINTIDTLLSLVLNNNIFTFNDEYYKQINGTAMGTIMAPTYANCYLKSKEENGLKHWLQPDHPNLKIYKRYIDDILCIFDNTSNQLPRLLKDMKKAYSPLELTFKMGRTAVVYLDTELTLNDSTKTIDYEMHRKPSNNKTYTPADSNHPRHMLENTIFNDFLRAHRLCNNKLKLQKHLAIITCKAFKRGYSKYVLKRLQVNAKSRASHLGVNKHAQTAEYVTPAYATLTYTGSHTKQLVKNIREHWSSTADPRTKLLLGFKTCDNLKNLLVRSKAPKHFKLVNQQQAD